MRACKRGTGTRLYTHGRFATRKTHLHNARVRVDEVRALPVLDEAQRLQRHGKPPRHASSPAQQPSTQHAQFNFAPAAAVLAPLQPYSPAPALALACSVSTMSWPRIMVRSLISLMLTSPRTLRSASSSMRVQ